MFGIYQARVLAEYKVIWIITQIKKFISKTIDYIYFDYMYFIWFFLLTGHSFCLLRVCHILRQDPGRAGITNNYSLLALLGMTPVSLRNCTKQLVKKVKLFKKNNSRNSSGLHKT